MKRRGLVFFSPSSPLFLSLWSLFKSSAFHGFNIFWIINIWLNLFGSFFLFIIIIVFLQNCCDVLN